MHLYKTLQHLIKPIKLIGFLWLIIPLAAMAQKNDTLYLLNGDRITGELKKYESGLFYVSTDAMKTVNIQFDWVQTFHSQKNFDIRTKSGYRYFGQLLKSPSPASVQIALATDTIDKPIWDIVQITPLKNIFWQKFDGSIDLGISYTKATNILQTNTNTWLGFRSNNFLTELSYKNIQSGDGSDNNSTNTDYGLSVTRYYMSKWFAVMMARGQHNTELDIDYRYLAGAGAGYLIVQNNKVRFYTTGGFVGNLEQSIDSALQSANYEAVWSTSIKWFQYRIPKADLNSTLMLYKSLNISGRYRAEYDLTAKFEIISDVKLGFTLYFSYDKKPTGSAMAKNDWGVSSSVGYTF